MEITSFIVEQLFILIAALGVVGTVLKNSKVDDKLIPWILLPLAIIGSIFMLGSFDVNSIIQGILCWGTSIGIHQAVIVQPKK